MAINFDSLAESIVQAWKDQMQVTNPELDIPEAPAKFLQILIGHNLQTVFDLGVEVAKPESLSEEPEMPHVEMTSEDWRQAFQGLQIINPDGWDRKNFHNSFNVEKIGLEEFIRRVSLSSCNFPPDFIIQYGPLFQGEQNDTQGISDTKETEQD